MPKKPLSKLEQSSEILELRPVNPYFVSRYRQAMRSGSVFPPIVINKDNVIVSGNHRYEAYMKEYPTDHEVDVEVRSYKTHAELIKDAVRENIDHGNPIDGITRKRAIQKLIELDEDKESIAQLLNISVKRVMDLAGMYMVVRGSGNNQEKVPTKRGTRHLAGKTVTKDQYDKHIKRDRGVSIRTQAEQIIRWLENGWVDLSDPAESEALMKLREVLNEQNLEVPELVE